MKRREVVRIKIRPTLEDVRRGERGNCGECPIALAVTRALGVANCVRVDATSLRIWASESSGSFVEFRLPARVVDFIDAFDAWRPVKVRDGAFDILWPVPGGAA